MMYMTARQLPQPRCRHQLCRGDVSLADEKLRQQLLDGRVYSHCSIISQLSVCVEFPEHELTKNSRGIESGWRLRFWGGQGAGLAMGRS